MKSLSPQSYLLGKRLFQKVAIHFIKVLDPSRSSNRRVGEYETEVVSICRKLIGKDDTILLISPITNKRYIRSEDEQLFIIIDDIEFTIVNHTYSYNIKLEPKAAKRISTIFDNEVEKRRIKMENEIRSNVKHSLSNIYKSLVDEQV